MPLSQHKTKKKRKLISRLRYKYRLVIMRDDTFEERFSFRLSPLNVFVALGSGAILLVFLTTYIIAFTPLKEYIPGYADFDTRKNIRTLILKADSLEADLKRKDLYIFNIKNIIEGKTIVEELPANIEKTNRYDTITISKSMEDSLLRAEVESQDQYSLSSSDVLTNQTSSISSFFFFTPVKGLVTNSFNPSENHFGIDIVAESNKTIKSTLDGVVIFSSWTLGTGYTIAVQHQNNLISIYKHNSVLLKRDGDYVKAGDPISIIGETGEMSTGPHLHFELWYNGMPINPKDYMIFN